MDETSAPTPPVPPAGGTGTDAFFDSVRRTGIVRSQERWAGGVAGGLALRLGVDPLVTRGLLAASVLLGGFGLVVYAIGWLLLPEQSDGRIHLQQLFRGDFDAAVLGALALFVAGASFPDSWAPGLWWAPDAGWWSAIVWVVAATVVVVLVVSASRGRTGTGAPPAAWTAPVPPPPGTPGDPGQPTSPAAAAPRHRPEGPTTTMYPTSTPPTGPSGPGTPGAGGPLPAGPAASGAAAPAAQPRPAGPTATATGGLGAQPGGTWPSGGQPGRQQPPSTQPGWQQPAGRPGAAWQGAPYQGTPSPGAPYQGAPYQGAQPPAGPTTALPRSAPRGPGAGVVGVVVALSLLTFAGLLYADRVGRFDGPVVLTAGAVAVTLLGLAILVSGLRGRTAGGLGGLAVVLALVLVPMAAVDRWAWQHDWRDWEGGQAVGDVTHTPRTADEAQQGYSVGAGQIDLDLTELPLEDGTTIEVPIGMGAGDVTVLIPEGAAVAADVQVMAGEIHWLDDTVRSATGADGSRTFRTAAVDDDADAELHLDVTVGAGNVRVEERP